MAPTLEADRRWRQRVMVAVAVGAAVLLGSTCGDDGSDTASTSGSVAVTVASVAGVASTVTTGEEAAVSAAVDDLAVACGAQDRDRLRDLSGDGVRDRVRDQDQLFTEVEELTVIDREISITGDTATVTAMVEVTVDGDTSQVERVWTFERVDGVWLLSEVPDCLFS